MGTGVGVGVDDAGATRNASKSTGEGSPPAGRDSCNGAEASGAMVGLDVGGAWEDEVSCVAGECCCCCCGGELGGEMLGGLGGWDNEMGGDVEER